VLPLNPVHVWSSTSGGGAGRPVRLAGSWRIGASGLVLFVVSSLYFRRVERTFRMSFEKRTGEVSMRPAIRVDSLSKSYR